MNIQLVGVHQIDSVWPVVKKHIERAIAKCDDLTLSGIYELCRSGRGFLFVTDDLKASLVLSFESRTGGEVARILALGSDTKADWKLYTEEIRKFAKANGAEKLVFQGRKGWARVFGKQPKYYFYEV